MQKNAFAIPVVCWFVHHKNMAVSVEINSAENGCTIDGASLQSTVQFSEQRKSARNW
jgi:hypothetical protein